MYYDPVTPVDNIFSKVEGLVEYDDIENCPYYYPQEISKVYNIIKKTRKSQEYIKAQNRLPPIQKTWIAFKTHFFEINLELTKTK